MYLEMPWNSFSWELYNFVAWMIEKGNFSTPEEVLAFLEKPWHWEDEYQEMKTEEDNLKIIEKVLPRMEIVNFVS